MGFGGELLGCLKKYLTKRSFQAFILRELSHKTEISSGLPQGGILSPTLYNIFISDIPETENVKISAYANDLCLYATADDMQIASTLMENTLNEINLGANRWKININTDKTCFQYYPRKLLTHLP